MASLGALGTQREALDLDFEWFGATIRVKPDLSELVLSEFGDMALAVATLNDGLAEMQIIKQMMREIIHLEDFDEFWSLARSNRQDRADLEAVGVTVIEAVASRPTGLPSDSSPGRQTTEPNSTDDSSLRVMRQYEQKGRPDIAQVIQLAQRSA